MCQQNPFGIRANNNTNFRARHLVLITAIDLIGVQTLFFLLPDVLTPLQLKRLFKY